MRVERDIAGFALPFTVGVFITIYAGAIYCIAPSFMATGILALILTSSSLLLCRQRVRLGAHLIRATIFLAAFGCGALAGVTDLSMPVRLPETDIETYAHLFCLKMQEKISSTPFQSAECGSLLKALLTGNRSALSPKIIEIFRDSGASHILALSGLHLGIIYGILSKILQIIGNNTTARMIRASIIIATCGFYTLSTGAGASIVRAFIFVVLGEIASLTGRKTTLVQILSASLIIQLIISPASIKTISFQLSYAAIAGIAVIYPWFKKLWPEGNADSKSGRAFETIMRWIWNSVSLSISCQLTTAPLAYIYFGTVPQYFILTNLLALPLTCILIPTALITILLTTSGFSPMPLIHLTDTLTQLLLKALEIIATM